jgi:fatty-acyl-CoA synthase
MLHRWIERHADHTPNRIALRFEGEAITWAELAQRVERMAGSLASLGVRPGDRVGYLGANHPAQIVMLAACARLGAIQLPLNWRLAAPELRFMLEDAGCRLLLATTEHAEQARQAAPASCEMLNAEHDFRGAPHEAAGEETDAVLLVYTSGTTGRPKGAVLDQRALVANAMNSLHMHAMTPADRVLTALPLFHVGGLNIQTTPALFAGAEVTLLRRFDPVAFLDAVERERPTLSLVVPAVMQALLAHPRWASADLSCLRAVGAGSSEVPLPLIEAFHARGIPVQQVYGSTETCPIAIYQLADEALAAPGSIGRPAIMTEARVVDARGQPARPGEAGEIQLRGAHVLRGYWGRDDALLPGGWFPTGDVGRIDAHGRWWFTDRLKHLIISGGENISPAEVERVLATAPGVKEGAVVGRPDPRWGEVPVAVVVPGEGFDAARVLSHFEGRLARFKQPRDVVTVDALPRTALGKVAVGELRKLIAI